VKQPLVHRKDMRASTPSGLSNEHQDSGCWGGGQENADQGCGEMEVVLGWPQIFNRAGAALAEAMDYS
jgi:hypothetical protein